MNTANLILAQNESFKFVTVRFIEGDFSRPDSISAKAYTYKTTLDLSNGDLAVVESPTGFKVVIVEDIKELAEVSNNIEYKWIVSKVDLEYYEGCKKVETEVNKQVNRLEFEKTRKQFNEELKERLGEDAVITLQGIAKL